MDARAINTLPSILTRFQTVIPVFFVPILLSSLMSFFKKQCLLCSFGGVSRGRKV